MSAKIIGIINVGGGPASGLEHQIAKLLHDYSESAGQPVKAREVQSALMNVAGQIISQTPEGKRQRFLNLAMAVLTERSEPL